MTVCEFQNSQSQATCVRISEETAREQRLARLARRLLRADAGAVFIRKAGAWQLSAVEGASPADAMAQAAAHLPPADNSCQPPPDASPEPSPFLCVPLTDPVGYCCVWHAQPLGWSVEDRESLVELVGLGAREVSAGESSQTTCESVTRVLADAVTVSEAIPEVLRVLAEVGGWEFGAFWALPAGRGDASLRCEATWRSSPEEMGLDADSQTLALPEGEGLPWNVIHAAAPLWRASLEAGRSHREDAALQSGLGSAFAFPIQAGDVPLGALEFYSRRNRVVDPDAFQDAVLIGRLLGQFIQRRHAEAALQESEELLSFALDAGDLGTWDWNVRTNQLKWSPSLQRLHGLEPGAFPGSIDAFMNDMHPDDREYVLTSVQNALAGNGDHHVEYRIVRPDGSQRWVLGRGRMIADESGIPVRMTGICMDITERKQSELAIKFLAEASTLLGASLDYHGTLAAVARLAVPSIADWCAVDLVGPDGQPRRLAVAHSTPAEETRNVELPGWFPSHPDSPIGLDRILRTGRPELLSEIPESLLETSSRDVDRLGQTRSPGVRSYIGVPLKARDEVFGAVTLLSAESGRRFGPEDLALAEELARRAAIAIDNARLFKDTDEAEQQLRDRLEFIHAVTQSLEDGILAVNGEGRITFINPAAERMLRSNPGDLAGRPVTDTLRHRIGNGTPAPLPLAWLAEQAVRTHQDGEALLRQDGTWFPVAYTCAPLKTGETRSGAVLLFQDVTAARAEEEARELRARHAALVADVGVALNHPGSLRELLHGCTEAMVQHIGAAFARIWTFNQQEQILELVASSGLYTHLDGKHARVPLGAFKIGLIAEERVPHLTNDVAHDPRVGNPEWARENGMVSFAGYPLLVEDRLVGVLALFARHPLAEDTLGALGAIAYIVAQGIERKRSEERVTRLNTTLERRVRERTAALTEVNQELESFSYSVSHDLRAPLRHVLGFADMLEKRSGALLDENGRRYLRTIQESARHAGTLVDDLLAFSRMGRTELRHQQVCMDALVKQALQDIYPEVRERVIRWNVEALPDVVGDTAMLRLVWRNLLSNAAKYTRGREPAEIFVSAEATPDEVVFTVRDNGVGFDMRYVDKLFGVFQRLHSTEEFEGTGIGLANVRRIVKRHGGRTWAEGVLHEGASFYFALPRVPQSKQPLAPEETTA